MEATDLKSSYGAGTAFTVLDHTTAIAFGTTTPSVSLGFGTWMVFARVVASCVAATLAGTETMTIALKDASSNVISTTTITLPPITTANFPLVTISLPIGIVNNSSATMTIDTIVIHAALSGDPSAGKVDITAGEIIALRVY